MQNVLEEFQVEESCSKNEQDREAQVEQAVGLLPSSPSPSSQTNLPPLVASQSSAREPSGETVSNFAGNSDETRETRKRYPGAFSSDQPTPFEKSRLGEQFQPSGLHNAREAYYPIQHEKGIHRLIAMMHVRGDTNKEIAKELDRSEVCISNILRQPYVQQYIVEEVKRLGGEQVQLVLKGAALKAAQRLLAEIDNTNTGSAQSRIAAANSTLDRVFGKAPQSITHYDGGDVDQLSDAEIAQRLRDLEQQKAN